MAIGLNTVLTEVRAGALAGFFDMLQVPEGAAISGLAGGRKRGEFKGAGALLLGPRPLYSARNSQEAGPRRDQRGSPAISVSPGTGPRGSTAC
ncbi:hypothetical protein BRADO4037 [Bradyrhizobium sp. ORS 278]|nr:hypothetical protein BRADO4037 [Bradyrhizobium sp. ORS 278]